MLDCLASLVAEEHFDIFSSAGYPTRSGNFQDRLVPFGVYKTADGHVAIVAFGPEWMRGLFETMGRADILADARFATRGPRMKHADELNAMIEHWTANHSTEEVVAKLVARQVPCGPVRTALQVLSDPKLRERGAVVELEHPTHGKIGATGMGLPIHFSDAQAAFDRPADELGASSAEILMGVLGMSEEAVADLRARRVV